MKPEAKALRREIVSLMTERAKHTAKSKAAQWHELNKQIIALQRKLDGLSK